MSKPILTRLGELMAWRKRATNIEPGNFVIVRDPGALRCRTTMVYWHLPQRRQEDGIDKIFGIGGA